MLFSFDIRDDVVPEESLNGQRAHGPGPVVWQSLYTGHFQWAPALHVNYVLRPTMKSWSTWGVNTSPTTLTRVLTGPLHVLTWPVLLGLINSVNAIVMAGVWNGGQV